MDNKTTLYDALGVLLAPHEVDSPQVELALRRHLLRLRINGPDQEPLYKEHLIQRISEAIMADLLHHKSDESNTIYLQDSSKPNYPYFSYLVEEDAKPITEDEALHIITQAVTHHISEYKIILVYTCRDNAELAIEDYGDDFDGDTLEYSDEVIPGVLFIGYD